MFTNDLLKLEQAISRLSREEQLWLVERVIHNMRVSPAAAQPALNGQSALASQPNIEPKPAQSFRPTPTNPALPPQPPTALGTEGRPTIKELDPSVQAQLRAIDDAIAELDGSEPP